MYPQRKPNRFKNYDYSNAGYYYVTICTFQNIPYFGNINSGQVIYNLLGEVALRHWKQIPQHFNNVGLDEYIIMPNHLHGIVKIYDTVGNRLACSVENKRNIQFLPKLIGGYKAGVTREVKAITNELNFKWQKSYYDHIIRNNYSLQLIRKYILNNPKRLNGTDESVPYRI